MLIKGSILRIIIKQDKAVFRVPYSMEIIETFPLPPYSTISGFVHNMLGIKSFIEEMNISIQGSYGGLIRDYVIYHKFSKNSKEASPYPIVVTSLIDVEFLIHIKMPDEKLKEDLIRAIKNPPFYPYLGRAEDLITEIYVEDDKEIIFDPEKSEEGGKILPYNAYIPIKKAEYYELSGIRYLIPGFYRKNPPQGRDKISLRLFEYIPVMYVQAGKSITKKICVDKEGIPIWWMK